MRKSKELQPDPIAETIADAERATLALLDVLNKTDRRFRQGKSLPFSQLCRLVGFLTHAVTTLGAQAMEEAHLPMRFACEICGNGEALVKHPYNITHLHSVQDVEATSLPNILLCGTCHESYVEHRQRSRRGWRTVGHLAVVPSPQRPKPLKIRHRTRT